MGSIWSLLLNFRCWPILNDIRKLSLRCLNTKQKEFEDEWEYHPQALWSFLDWNLFLFKDFPYHFYFFQIYITELFLYSENSTSCHAGYIPNFKWHKFCGVPVCLKSSEPYHVWWWRYCVLELKIGDVAHRPCFWWAVCHLAYWQFQRTEVTGSVYFRMAPIEAASIAVWVSTRDRSGPFLWCVLGPIRRVWRTSIYLPHVVFTNILTILKTKQNNKKNFFNK